MAQYEMAAAMQKMLAVDDLLEAERSLARRLLDVAEAQRRMRLAKTELAALRRGRAWP